MGISDMIALFIKEMLAESETGFAELQRNELAQKFNCVPSQINYVISTRFPPEHGYIVESRRGGGGYIRIQQVQSSARLVVMHAVNSVGDSISQQSAKVLLNNLQGAGAFSPQEAKIIAAAVGNSALGSAPPEARDAVRADVLKQMLLAVE